MNCGFVSLGANRLRHAGEAWRGSIATDCCYQADVFALDPRSYTFLRENVNPYFRSSILGSGLLAAIARAVKSAAWLVNEVQAERMVVAVGKWKGPQHGAGGGVDLRDRDIPQDGHEDMLAGG